MSAAQGSMRTWIKSFAADVKTVEELLSDGGASGQARALAAAALSYAITRLDLVPDWEEAIGIVDDAIVLRVACGLAAERGLGRPAEALERKIAALANQIDAVEQVLGERFAAVRKYVDDLTLETHVVRGRTAGQLVESAKLRAKLSVELADELKRPAPGPITDEAHALRLLYNHLDSKLAAKTAADDAK